jgi:hypothetical protein
MAPLWEAAGFAPTYLLICLPSKRIRSQRARWKE